MINASVNDTVEVWMDSKNCMESRLEAFFFPVVQKSGEQCGIDIIVIYSSLWLFSSSPGGKAWVPVPV